MELEMRKSMESFDSKPHPQRNSNWMFNLFNLLLIISLAAFSSYLCVELKSLQRELGHLREEVNRQPDEVPTETLTRNERGGVGSIDPVRTTGATGLNGASSETTTGPTGRDGSLPSSRVSYVSYNQWGTTTCSGDGNPIFDGVHGITTAFHDSNGNLVRGSDVYCISIENNNLRSATTVRTGLQLQAAEFNLYGYSTAFDQPNKNGHLSCTECFVQGTDVRTQIGKDCVNPEWATLYSGYMVTSYSTLGTSESICVDNNASPAAGLFTRRGLSPMLPAKSGTGSPFPSHGTIIPCKVCYRKASARTRLVSLDVGLHGPSALASG